MNLKEGSRICLCSDFKIDDSDFSQGKLIEFLKKINFLKVPKQFDKQNFYFRKRETIPSLLLFFEFEYITLDGIKEKNKKILKNLREERENLDDDNQIELIDYKIRKHKEIYKKAKEKLKKPQFHLKFECRMDQDLELLNINEKIEKSLYPKIFRELDKYSKEDFRITLCNFLRVDKKTNLYQDENFQFRRKIELNSEISDQIGELVLHSINFEVNQSKLGIKEIEFYEDEKFKGLNFIIEFSDKKLSNLEGNFKLINDVIKLFKSEG
jgi:hypothetical protein